MTRAFSSSFVVGIHTASFDVAMTWSTKSGATPWLSIHAFIAALVLSSAPAGGDMVWPTAMDR